MVSCGIWVNDQLVSFSSISIINKKIIEYESSHLKIASFLEKLKFVK